MILESVTAVSEDRCGPFEELFADMYGGDVESKTPSQPAGYRSNRKRCRLDTDAGVVDYCMIHWRKMAFTRWQMTRDPEHDDAHEHDRQMTRLKEDEGGSGVKNI